MVVMFLLVWGFSRKFDIDALERDYNLSVWRQRKKHAVLRFVCDVPGEEDHLDIPAWLYEEIHDGVHYDTELGKGYSPNYANTRFREAHRRAISKLAEYCNQDSFFSYIELGSLGPWGEWHATDGSGRSLIPDAAICETYINLYGASFENALLLARRPYREAMEERMGVYNDMIGSLEATEEWLGWLERGGTQPTSGTPLVLQPLENLGKTAPVGGEFASELAISEYLGDGFGDVLASISSSGISFIGPMTPDLSDEETFVNRESILRRIGYRIYVSKLQINYDFSKNLLNVTLNWQNAGNAGFFFDWPVTFYAYNGEKQMVYWETLDLDLRSLNTGETVTTRIQVPFVDDIRDEFYLGTGITDYSGEERVFLSIDPEQLQGSIDQVQILYHYKK